MANRVKTLATAMGAKTAVVLNDYVGDPTNAGGYSYSGGTAVETVSGGSSIMGDAQKAAYYIERDWVIFYGAGHSGPVEKIVLYDVPNNQWATLHTNPYWAPDGGLHMAGFCCASSAYRNCFELNWNTYRVNQLNLDEADYADITADHWSPFVHGNVLGHPDADGTINRGGMDFFPERNELVVFAYNGGSLLRCKMKTDAAWEVVAIPDAVGDVDHPTCHYNRLHRCMVFGGGNNGTTTYQQWWKYDEFGVVTRLDDCPVTAHFGGLALYWHDPVSSLGCLLTPSTIFTSGGDHYDAFTLNLAAATGSQWQTDAGMASAFNDPSVYPMGDGAISIPPGGPCAQCVVVPLHLYGVTMFMGREKTYLYKHVLNTWAADGVPDATKAERFGSTVSFLACDDQAYFKYEGTSDPAILANYVALGITDIGYTIGEAMTPGMGNCTSIYQPVAGIVQTPHVVDGGLQWNRPGKTSESSPLFLYTLDGQLHATGTHPFWNPDVDRGGILFIAFDVRYTGGYLSKNFLSTRSAADGTFNDFQAGGLATCPAFSQTLQIPTGVLVEANVLGHEVVISDSGGGTFKRSELYTVTAVPDSTHFTVDRSPLANISVAGVNGYWSITGDTVIDGHKLCIIEPINANNNIILLNERIPPEVYVLSNKLGFYSYFGALNYGPDAVGPIVADVWQRVVLRIEMKSGQNGLGGNRLTLWIGGVLSVDQTNWATDWSSTNGMKQIEFVEQMTHKAAAEDYTECFYAIRNIHISTEPMGLTAGTGSEGTGAPTLTSIAPNSGTQNTTVSVTMVGSGFNVGIDAIVFSGAGLTTSGLSVTDDTTLSVNIIIAPTAAAGTRTVRIQTSLGISTSKQFTVIAADTLNFGSSTPLGSLQATYSPSYVIFCGPFTVPENMTLVGMDIYTSGVGVDVTMGIYRSVANAPTDRLAVTAGGVISGATGFAWRSQAISGSLAAGDVVFLAIDANGYFDVKYTVTATGKFQAYTYDAGVLPASVTTPFSALNEDFNIRVRYISAVGVVKVYTFLLKP